MVVLCLAPKQESRSVVTGLHVLKFPWCYQLTYSFSVFLKKTPQDIASSVLHPTHSNLFCRLLLSHIYTHTHGNASSATVLQQTLFASLLWRSIEFFLSASAWCIYFHVSRDEPSALLLALEVLVSSLTFHSMSERCGARMAHLETFLFRRPFLCPSASCEQFWPCLR